MKTLKSIGAILAGFLTVGVLSILTDSILEKVGVLPYGGDISTSLLILALFYRTLYTVLGGYVTAKLAPSKPMRHAMILLALGVVAGSAGAIVNSALGPAWYAWGIVVFSIPAIWFGAQLVKEKPIL